MILPVAPSDSREGHNKLDGDLNDSSSDDSIFFFQAEDGIRGPLVTGVQTCALPISMRISLGPRPEADTHGRPASSAARSSAAGSARIGRVASGFGLGWALAASASLAAR